MTVFKLNGFRKLYLCTNYTFNYSNAQNTVRFKKPTKDSGRLNQGQDAT